MSRTMSINVSYVNRLIPSVRFNPSSSDKNWDLTKNVKISQHCFFTYTVSGILVLSSFCFFFTLSLVYTEKCLFTRLGYILNE